MRTLLSVAPNAKAVIRDNELAAASSALGAAVDAAAFFRIFIEIPDLNEGPPGMAGLPDVLFAVGTWLWQRVMRPRSTATPRTFFLVIAGADVAALDLRFGRGVTVRRLLWRHPRSAVHSDADCGHLTLVLPGRDPLVLEPLEFDASSAAVFTALTGSPPSPHT